MTPGGETLAVIIPFYRGMEFVPQLKTSFEGQPVDELIFVVDDGESGPALRQEFEGWDNVRILETTGSLGTSPARNVGLRAATAAWVAPVDQDDWWPEDFVEQLRLPDDGAVVAYDNVVWHGPAGAREREPQTVLEESGFELRSFDKTHEAVKDYLPMFKLVLRREDALAVGGYSEWAYAVEDYDFLMKLLGRGLRIEVCESPRGNHLRHVESISRLIAAGSASKGRRAFRTWMRIYAGLAVDRSFPLATRRTFVWRWGVALKGWILLSAKDVRAHVPGLGA